MAVMNILIKRNNEIHLLQFNKVITFELDTLLCWHNLLSEKMWKTEKAAKSTDIFQAKGGEASTTAGASYQII